MPRCRRRAKIPATPPPRSGRTTRTLEDDVDSVAPFALAREALILAATLCLPVVAATALVGLVVGALQSATNIQDSALTHLPRLVVVTTTVLVMLPWMAHTLLTFAQRAFGN